ncbi:DUF4199 domain-containing protein [Flavobacterium sp.]|uniref:DUF4199 domain-containing protein n=1 Tax=Flavobacterium sp. TaxID=239 RepID=UPI003750090B
MENTTSPAKSGLLYGLLFGVIMILEFVIGYVMNIDPQTNQGYGITINVLNFFVLPSTFIYLGCNNYKMKLNSGFISFGECLRIGVTICIIAGLISALFSSVFGMIFPEYFEEMYRKVSKMMMEKNPQMTSEQLDMAVSMMKKFSNPVIAIPASIAIYAFIGLIYSLIIGAILKKDANQSY